MLRKFFELLQVLAKLLWDVVRPRPVQPPRRFSRSVPDGKVLHVTVWHPKDNKDYMQMMWENGGVQYPAIGWGRHHSNIGGVLSKYVDKRFHKSGRYYHTDYIRSLPNKASKELHAHEFWGHVLNGYHHEEGHPVMDGTSDGHRVPLGKRVKDPADFEMFWAQVIHQWPCIEIHMWLPGMDYDLH